MGQVSFPGAREAPSMSPHPASHGQSKEDLRPPPVTSPPQLSHHETRAWGSSLHAATRVSSSSVDGCEARGATSRREDVALAGGTPSLPLPHPRSPRPCSTRPRSTEPALAGGGDWAKRGGAVHAEQGIRATGKRARPRVSPPHVKPGGSRNAGRPRIAHVQSVLGSVSINSLGQLRGTARQVGAVACRRVTGGGSLPREMYFVPPSARLDRDACLSASCGGVQCAGPLVRWHPCVETRPESSMSGRGLL